MDYRGMIVTERLFRSGRIREFDAAIENKDVERVIEILRSVDLDDGTVRTNLEFSGLMWPDNIES